jgi:hypothetical protein
VFIVWESAVSPRQRIINPAMGRTPTDRMIMRTLPRVGRIQVAEHVLAQRRFVWPDAGLVPGAIADVRS